MKGVLIYSVFSILVVSALVWFAVDTVQKTPNQHTDRESMQTVTNVVNVSAMILWPILYYMVLQNWAFKYPVMSIGFVWPLVLILIQLWSSRKRDRERNGESQLRHNQLRNTAAALVSGALGVGVLLAAINSNSDLKTSVATKKGSMIIMLSLLIVIALILPSNYFRPESYEAHIIRAVQGSSTHIAIGLFIVGVILCWLQPSQLD